MKRILALLFLLPGFALAANTDIGTGTGTFDCNTDCGGACAAGDTLTLLGTARGSLLLKNCTQGTAVSPITLRNDVTESSPITISRSGSGFALWIDVAENLVVDGTGLWSGVTPGKGCGASFSDTTGDESNQACGIVVRCSANFVTTLVKVRHDVTSLTIRGLELDGNFPACVRPGIGMGLSDNNQTQDDNPGEYYEDMLIEDNYIHDMATECMYNGGNILTPRLQESRDNTYRRNLLRRCGWDALSLKTHDSTMSFVYDNIVIESGVNPDGLGVDGNSGACYNAFEAAQITWYNNWAADCAGNGPGICYESLIAASTTTDIAEGQQVIFYNNVGVDCKGRGISTSVNPRQGTITSLEMLAYNNTIVNAGSDGIFIDDDTVVAGTVQDNLVCDSGGNDIDMGSGAAHVATSNTTGACSAQLFENLVGRDFHLASVSAPAYDAGGIYVSPPAFDFDNQSRPLGTNEEDGAYEFIEAGGGPGGGITAPKPEPHTIDAGETHYPHHLYVLNEGATSTTEDDGSSTDADLTITGADWSTDAFGPYLQFIDANSDFAENSTTVSAFTGTVTMCAVIRINGPQGTPSERFMQITDASAVNQLTMQTTGGLGYLQGFAWDATISNTSEGPPEVTDNEWNMVCVRGSDSILDISINGSAWDTESQGLTGMLTGIDTIALGGDRSTDAAGYADIDILAAWIYRATKTDANMVTIYNAGDPWPVIGVDPTSGPPPVAQRGQFKNAGTQ